MSASGISEGTRRRRRVGRDEGETMETGLKSPLTRPLHLQAKPLSALLGSLEWKSLQKR
jgi:hypothetical protein